MSEVKRYTFHRELYTGWHPESLDEERELDDVIDGGVASMVLASDYDKLEADNRGLEQELAEARGKIDEAVRCANSIQRDSIEPDKVYLHADHIRALKAPVQEGDK